MTVDSVRELAKKLVQIEAKINALGGPQLAYSSLEDGAVNEYDQDQLVSTWGRQYDGTHGVVTLAGPTPPTPSAPSVVALAGQLLVRYDGTFSSGLQTVAPQDWSRVEVHVSTDGPDFSAILFDTLRGSIESPRGGEIAISGLPINTDLWVRLTVRTAPGNFSAPSVPVGPVQVQGLTADDLGIDLDSIGGSHLYGGADEPEAPAGGHRIGDLWNAVVDVGPPVETEARQWDGAIWVPLRSQRVTQALADALAADQAARDAADVAAGRLQLFEQPEEPPALASDERGLWVDTDAGNRQSTWDGSAWVPRRVGNAAIEPQSLVLSDLAVTGSVTAALLESVMVLASVIIAGDPDGNHARMTADGFQVLVPSPLAGAPPYRAVVMGDPTGRNTFGVADESGALLANIDEAGKASFRQLNVIGDPIIQGRRLVSDLLTRGPRGEIAWGQGFPDRAGIVAETSLFGVGWAAEAGRKYRITVTGIRFANSATGPNVGALLLLRENTAAGGETELSRKIVPNPIGAFTDDGTIVFDYATSISGVRQVRLSIAAVGASVHAQYYGGAPYKMSIEDIGPRVPATGATYATPSPEVAKEQVVWEQSASWSASYRENGARRTDTAELYQGYYPDGYNGNNRSLIGWPDVTAMLAGADVQQVLVYLYANHWWNGTGGTAVIGAHGLASQPGTYAGPIGPDRFRAAMGRGTGQWFDISGWGGEFKGGSVRGVVLGPGPSNSLDFYGQFNGHTQPLPPRLRIVYAK